jgi:GAF domain-containing protein
VIAEPDLQAMRTAEHVFATTSPTDRSGLLETAARALAIQPGHLCLVSLVEGHGGQEVLRPVCVAHAQPGGGLELRQALAASREPRAEANDDLIVIAPDAFSRAVQRSRSSLRMQLGSPRLWRLWLPPEYWAYADRVYIRAVLAAALVRHGRVVGTLLLWREGETAAAFTAADQAYVVAMAARLALGLG